MRFRTAVSLALILALVVTQTSGFGQNPDPRDRGTEEKRFIPQAMGTGATSLQDNKSSLVKWVILGGLAVAAGVILFLVLRKKNSTSTPPPGAKMGSLVISSDPTGARIFLDGRDTGQVTPVTLNSVSAGPHALKLDLASFGNWEGQVEVLANQATNVAATLAPYIYVFMSKWGSFGTGNGQFNLPSGLAVDGSDNLYVTDSFSSRVQKFTSTGAFLTQWGGSGSGPGRFSLIDGIAADSASNIYVADGALTDAGDYNHRVQKFSADGRFLSQWGTYGAGDGQFFTPVGLSISKTGYLYAIDMDLGRVQKFTLDGSFLLKWGSIGAGDGQFQRPHFSAVDADGNVYVSEYDGHRIQKFSANGAFLAKWGTFGSADGQLRNPAGILVDRAGYVLVCDSMNHRLQKFTRDGKFIAKWGGPGSGDGQFNETVGIAEDSQGHVYISDYRNYRIQKIRLTTSTVSAARITYSPQVRPGSPARMNTPRPPDANRVPPKIGGPPPKAGDAKDIKDF